MLSVRNLSASFHTRAGIVRAVRNVSFDVAPGETLGIVGESGSGKSVTCYSIMGLIPMPPGRIESGSAMLDGTDLLRCPEKELRAIRGKRISMIFQDPMTSLNPYLTIGEQVAEPLVIHEGAGKKEARSWKSFWRRQRGRWTFPRKIWTASRRRSFVWMNPGCM